MKIANVLKALKNKSLTEIHFPGDKIGDKGARVLKEVLKLNNQIKHVHFCDNEIGDEGGIALAEALKINVCIEDFRLKHNEIGDQSAKALAKALKVNNTVKMIDLENNKIGDEGAIALAEVLKVNKTIKRIDLGHNEIGYEGATALAEVLKVNKTIKWVGLGHNEIEDISISAQTFVDDLNANKAQKIKNQDLIKLRSSGHYDPEEREAIMSPEGGEFIRPDFPIKETFLTNLIESKKEVSMYNGTELLLKGVIVEFDKECIFCSYKDSVSLIDRKNITLIRVN